MESWPLGPYSKWKATRSRIYTHHGRASRRDQLVSRSSKEVLALKFGEPSAVLLPVRPARWLRSCLRLFRWASALVLQRADSGHVARHGASCKQRRYEADCKNVRGPHMGYRVSYFEACHARSANCGELGVALWDNAAAALARMHHEIREARADDIALPVLSLFRSALGYALLAISRYYVFCDLGTATRGPTNFGQSDVACFLRQNVAPAPASSMLPRLRNLPPKPLNNQASVLRPDNTAPKQ